MNVVVIIMIMDTNDGNADNNSNDNKITKHYEKQQYSEKQTTLKNNKKDK